MSAMDFCNSNSGATTWRNPFRGLALWLCNYLHFVGATNYIFVLQRTTFRFYNKHVKGNGDPRTILVGDEGFQIIDLIRAIHNKNKVLTTLLFPNVSESNVQCKLYRICKTLGLTERSPHKWRKTYISTLLNKGVDADFVRRQAGHKDIQTTYNSYTYSTTREEKQIEQLNQILAV